MGPVEAGVTLVDLATEIRRQVHLMQATGELAIPSSDKQPEEAKAVMAAEVSKLQAMANQWRRVTPRERVKTEQAHPWLRTVLDGGIADVWYLDDSTIFMHPAMALPYLRAHDELLKKRGGSRNNEKTKVIIYAPEKVVEETRRSGGSRS